MLEGDDRRVFMLFAMLVRVLKKSSVQSRDDSKSSIEELSPIVVDVRVRHSISGRSAGENPGLCPIS